jgi:hypothetical protein
MPNSHHPYRMVVLTLVVALVLTSCDYSFGVSTIQDADSSDSAPQQTLTSTAASAPDITVNHTTTATVTPTPTPSPLPRLTGLEVSNPVNLNNPPALISITNFPASARPQCGMSFASWVFEGYIGDGMSRWLGVFYGEYPPDEAAVPGQDLTPAEIGPIRSGRIWYEWVRQLMNGFLVMASAWSGIAQNLNSYTSIFGSDTGDINSAMIGVGQIREIAQASQEGLGNASLGGNIFDVQVPEGGLTANMLWVRYALLNQVIWRWNPDINAFNRYQNDTQVGNIFTEDTDCITREPLTYENVIVLFADHHARAETLVDITRPALLFRDGQIFEIQWTTMNGEYERTTGRLRPIRFIGADGEPFPLAPGQTWITIIPMYTPYFETVDSTNVLDLINQRVPGSGNWGILFYPPGIEAQ